MQEMVYSAAVLARVAEAADGFRDGKTYYFVVNAASPRTVEWRSTRPEAEAVASTLQQGSQTGAGARWVVVGPCSTPEDVVKQPNGIWTVCTVSVEERDAAGNVVRTYDRVWRNGESSMDALFFNVSAMDKFLFPYYTAVYGAHIAADMRARFVEPGLTGPPCVPVCHDPKSDECACDEGGVTGLLVNALNGANLL